ncbi:hypothetical protein KTQ42_18210 [Noviherbaspirillum sp. L7-7A]|uniref:hypothetical protein n=1 Tax=Noviherbaspirillum sp. L7-7A TaxID=2850560 RepID=UPI001C2C69DA|nr:hypothetical protein [Noviherbaspirillum sp. L7-7A]MBV0881233.1 hypothetical protein [Noviherbaspirillum sp. L7-7A]
MPDPADATLGMKLCNNGASYVNTAGGQGLPCRGAFEAQKTDWRTVVMPVLSMTHQPGALYGMQLRLIN